MASYAVGRQKPLDNHLSRDSRVVRSRKVERRLALHPVPAHHQVFKRDCEGVSHVKFARNVGRRHDECERFLGPIDLRREISAFSPEIVYAPFDCARLIGSWNFVRLLSLGHGFPCVDIRGSRIVNSNRRSGLASTAP